MRVGGFRVGVFRVGGFRVGVFREMAEGGEHGAESGPEVETALRNGGGLGAERRGVDVLILCLRTGLTTEFAVLCAEGTERGVDVLVGWLPNWVWVFRSLVELMGRAAGNSREQGAEG